MISHLKKQKIMTNYPEKYQLIETEKKCGDNGINIQNYITYFNCILLYLACAWFWYLLRVKNDFHNSKGL